MAKGDKVKKRVTLEVSHDDLKGKPTLHNSRMMFECAGFDCGKPIESTTGYSHEHRCMTTYFWQERFEYEHLGDAHED